MQIAETVLCSYVNISDMFVWKKELQPPNYLQCVSVVGGCAVAVLRKGIMEVDPDLKLFRPIVEELVKDGKVELVEDYDVDNFLMKNVLGTMFVLRKLK